MRAEADSRDAAFLEDGGTAGRDTAAETNSAAMSLVLQLVSIALLLLAIAQLRLGSPDRSSRDHVLAAGYLSMDGGSRQIRNPAGRSETIRKAYLRAVPSTDRVMIVRADGLATPATGLESNRETDCRNRSIAARRSFAQP